MKLNFFSCFLFLATVTKAQFAPAAGQPGTSAMFKDSTAFLSWATGCTVSRGLQDISNPGMGYANVGDSLLATGMADASGVVCLGDGGYAILRFTSPLFDGSGNDFAVFENSFDDTFLELAFVEASSNGIDFFRFPAISNTDTVTQTWSFGLTDATKINNLAGKYRGGFGTPFDLADLPDHPLLDKQSVTHVKVIDVVGCIQNQYCTRDMNQKKINDPWPTGFGSGGFDLDAVGVIHHQPVSVKEQNKVLVRMYPNPVCDSLYIQNNFRKALTLTICSVVGEIVYESQKHVDLLSIDVSGLTPGVYVMNISDGINTNQIKFVKLKI